MNSKVNTIALVIISLMIVSISLPITKTPIANVQADNPLNIVASISIVADIATQIGRGLFTVESIVSGSEDPHLYEPSPSEIEAVANADLFIRLNLEGLEPWVEAVLLANPAVPVLNLVNPSMQRYDPLIEAINPHVWMDPSNVKLMVDRIYDEMVLLDPTNSAIYTANRDLYKTELDDLLTLINATKIEFEGLKVVVHHPAFMYLFDLLGIERFGVIEKTEGEEPSPEYIASIVEIIKTENITLLINQPQLDEKQISEIARDTGIQIAELTPLLGVPDVKGLILAQGRIIDNYITMIKYNLEALKNPYDPIKISNIATFWTLVSLGGAGFIATFIVVGIVRFKKPNRVV
ncbi:MAG: zinc ABC transporter substrate-binding protein [Candidatus Heimdallarchaeota archaeon]|nr:zinc ABC transporter substrate-binding protein [Candidatus Heimdallarchaeota archaeon]